MQYAIGVFDISGATVRGAVHGERLRAAYRDGRLVVVVEPDDVRTFASEGEPQRKGRRWMMMIGGSWTVIQPPGCGCRVRKELAAVDLEPYFAGERVG